MNLRFNCVDIESFRSIDIAHIDLSNQGTVIVKGINEYEDKATSNGSGKSSVFESIIFALFEETSSGEKDVANRIKDNGYVIVLDFDIDSDNYKIERNMRNGKSSVVLWKNGLDISARNKTDTNKLILQILGINKSIFLDSIFLSQNANTNLASLTPTARKERLEILTNTDYIINDFKEKLKEKQIEYESKCVESQMNIQKLNGKVDVHMQQKNSVEAKIKEINNELERIKNLGNLQEIENEIKYKEESMIPDIDFKITKLEEFISEKGLEVNNLRNADEEYLIKKQDLEKQKQEKLNEWNVLDKQIQQIKNYINFSNQENTRIDKEIEKIKNSDKCPTCGRKYENANEEHILQVIQELEQSKSKNNKDIEEYNLKIQKINDEVQEVEKQGRSLNSEILKISAVIEEQKTKIKEVEDRKKEFENQKQEAYNEKNLCQNQINNLKSKKEEILKIKVNNVEEYENMLDDISKQLSELDKQIKQNEEDYIKNNDYVSVIKNSMQLVTKEFRTYLLQNSIDYLNVLLKTYSIKLFSNERDLIHIEDDDSKLNIKLGNATYESLSGGEKTRVNIALLLAQKSMASVLGNISCNIIILDEILGYCDSQAEENVINLITEELETLESIYMVSHKEIPVGYDTQLIILKNKEGLSRIINR